MQIRKGSKVINSWGNRAEWIEPYPPANSFTTLKTCMSWRNANLARQDPSLQRNARMGDVYIAYAANHHAINSEHKFVATSWYEFSQRLDLGSTVPSTIQIWWKPAGSTKGPFKEQIFMSVLNEWYKNTSHDILKILLTKAATSGSRRGWGVDALWASLSLITWTALWLSAPLRAGYWAVLLILSKHFIMFCLRRYDSRFKLQLQPYPIGSLENLPSRCCVLLLKSPPAHSMTFLLESWSGSI